MYCLPTTKINDCAIEPAVGVCVIFAPKSVKLAPLEKLQSVVPLVKEPFVTNSLPSCEKSPFDTKLLESICTFSTKPCALTLVAAELREKVKSPSPFSGLIAFMLPLSYPVGVRSIDASLSRLLIMI